MGPKGFELNYYSILYTRPRKKFRIKPEIKNSVGKKSRPARKLDPELLETTAKITLIQIKKTKVI